GPLAFLAAAFAAAVLCATIVDAVTGPRAASVAVAREAQPHLALRSTTSLCYTIENRSDRELRAGIIESPVRTLRFLEDETVAVVPPSSRVTVERPVLPISRGADSFGALYVWYDNRFGLLRRRLQIEAAEPFRVFPDLSALARYGHLTARKRTIDAGLRRLRARGAGTEFESVREWSDGDEFRAIDWNATARRGKMMVLQHEIERSQNVMLLIDCGRLMTPRVNERRKLDYAVTAALSLAGVAGSAGDRVGAVAFSASIVAATAPRSTRASIARLTELLYDLEPRFEEANYGAALEYLRRHLKKRSLIVLFTDAVDSLSQPGLTAELRSLARRHVLLCAFMSDAAIDAALAATPAAAADAYRAAVALDLREERRAAAARLTRAGAIVVDVPASELTVALVDRYLRVKQRGLL
ncbi:MAG TPA: DUF58 domain-containing protein, partial [Candidatus Tumulicola sp.]